MKDALCAAAALIALVATVSAPASAECRGALINGRPHELCDNAWDFSTFSPPPSLWNLPTLAPLPPLPSLPPLGASKCHQAAVQFGSEQPQWRQVCPAGQGRFLLPAR
jgi:hypothetical protein